MKRHVKTCVAAHIQHVRRAAEYGDVILLQSFTRTQWPEVDRSVTEALSEVGQALEPANEGEDTSVTLSEGGVH